MTPSPDANLALRATGTLAPFNQHGILTAADVHIASRLAALLHEPNESVILALALTVRSTRQGSVVLDLSTVAQTTPDNEESETLATPALPWPEPEEWATSCQASTLTNGPEAPLRQKGNLLWLTRYDAQEQLVADEFLARTTTLPRDLDLSLLHAGLDRLFPAPADLDQRLAAAVCALPRISVLGGGPGTGKTTTVSRLLALLREQHPEWRIALAAPTGKAAARLSEAVARSAATLPNADQERVRGLESLTLHRLLGWQPGTHSRFRHDHANRLPFDVVVVDEASMVSLTMMARLLDALRPTTRLILVGDPDQLASVEAGAVLADIVGSEQPGMRTSLFIAELDEVMPSHGSILAETTPARRVRDGVALLTTNHRFDASPAIGNLASAIRAGRTDDALDVLRSGAAGVELVEIRDNAPPGVDALDVIQREVVTWAAHLRAAALTGDHDTALRALDSHRLLCAHRRGPRGVIHWDALAKRWATGPSRDTPLQHVDGHYPGEPLLVTSNDYELGLFNGDTGVVTAAVDSARPGSLCAWFGRAGEPVPVPLVRLGGVQSAYAMTVHRTQGSQFGRVTVVFPSASSPLATRESLYTAVTRAADHVRVIGSIESIRTAIATPISRATGLQARLDR